MPVSQPPPSWASIRNKPTTVAGFGISDMASQTVANATNATNASTVTTVTTAQVLAAEAGMSVGAIGTYAFLNGLSAVTIAPGATLAGSSLQYSPNSAGSSSPAGTWRNVGNLSSSASASVWLRIA